MQREIGGYGETRRQRSEDPEDLKSVITEEIIRRDYCPPLPKAV